MRVVLTNPGEFFKRDKVGNKLPRVCYEKGHVFKNVTVTFYKEYDAYYNIEFEDGSIMPDMYVRDIKIYSSDE